MIENINELAKFVKGGADVLQKAIESEEKTTLEFIDGGFVTDEDLESVKTKMFGDGKKEGQTIGYDFAMKDIKKDFGIDIEGKDREKIVKAVKDNILTSAKVEPNKKITELEGSITELRSTYNTDIAERDGQINDYKRQFNNIKIDSQVVANMPEIKGLKGNQFATLARNEYEFNFDENGTLYASKNGNPIKDKLANYIPVKDVLTDFATQNGWTSTNGRGGGNEGGNNSEFKSINDVYKHMETNNINPMSPDGEKLIKDFNDKN